MFSEAITAAALFPAKPVNHKAALLSEQALAEDWLKPDEAAAMGAFARGRFFN